MQKSIKDLVVFLQKLLPSEIPETYAISPVIKKISGEANIREGITAYRDFMYRLCNCLITDGDFISG